MRSTTTTRRRCGRRSGRRSPHSTRPFASSTRVTPNTRVPPSNDAAGCCPTTRSQHCTWRTATRWTEVRCRPVRTSRLAKSSNLIDDSRPSDDLVCHDLHDPGGGAGMYLSAERIAIANQAIKETFEQTSIAWQAIPHWDTGDPAQTKVRRDSACAATNDKGPLGENPVPIETLAIDFYVTVAQATAPTPDSLLAAVIARTVYLAAKVDGKVIDELRGKAQPGDIPGPVPGASQNAVNTAIAKLLNGLIDARAKVEDVGYRAPSCLLTNTVGLKALAQ